GGGRVGGRAGAAGAAAGKTAEPEPPPLGVAVEPPVPGVVAPPPPAAPVERSKSRAERGLSGQETFDFARTGKDFHLPPTSLLKAPPATERRRTREELAQNADLLRKRLEDFGVGGRLVQGNPGPVITGPEVEPAPGAKVE